jgi:hypothetical protein
MSHSPEPWNLAPNGMGDNVSCVDAQGDFVAGYSSDEGSIAPDDPNWQRIIACVNACRGFSTEYLVQQIRSQLPLPFDTPAGDVWSQARAWQEVWKELWSAGMDSFVSSKMNGSTRAIEFIRLLAEQAGLKKMLDKPPPQV